ncbi:MAG: adenosylcobinamide amidohydrolase [Nocardiopsaceae bacterium]|nr:adenosylcobinamide amidohydrolase [Nocardiopsaceae bacterium]
MLDAELWRRSEDGHTFGALVWQAGPGWRMIASSVLGGGIGPRSFVVNAQVSGDYRRTDPQAHLSGIAAAAGAAGEGVGLLTAADVDRAQWGADGGVEVLATVGIGRPTWAADSEELDEARLGDEPADGPLGGQGPGTINIVVAVPAALSDAALVNAVATATEAKVQAVMRAGYACTGTASDAVCVAARIAADGLPEEAFGGPRSRWGARIARAVHAAVYAGALDDADRLRADGADRGRAYSARS